MHDQDGGSRSRPGRPLDPGSTAVVLVGFRDEHVAEGGTLGSEIADLTGYERVLHATVAFLEQVATTATSIVATPMVLTPSEDDLVDPVGVLAAIKARGAFREGTSGSGLVDELARFGPRVTELHGRRGFSAFSHTELDASLAPLDISDVVIAGSLTCVCIDSTARAAFERGYRVTILSDCTLGRTTSEHRLFCERIFPLYAEVTTSDDVAGRLTSTKPVDG